MEMISVRSSNISQIGFEEKYIVFNRPPIGILRIIFTSGFTYDHHHVPREVYEAMLKAESVGKYYWANIKDKYEYEKVK